MHIKACQTSKLAIPGVRNDTGIIPDSSQLGIQALDKQTGICQEFLHILQFFIVYDYFPIT